MHVLEGLLCHQNMKFERQYEVDLAIKSILDLELQR
jgi:hypothetical protein